MIEKWRGLRAIFVDVVPANTGMTMTLLQSTNDRSSHAMFPSGVPRMLRNAPLSRRGALLIRGPQLPWVPALRRTAEGALHRVRDTNLR
jgi:hypothetical protein